MSYKVLCSLFLLSQPSPMQAPPIPKTVFYESRLIGFTRFDKTTGMGKDLTARRKCLTQRLMRERPQTTVFGVRKRETGGSEDSCAKSSDGPCQQRFWKP